MKLSCEDSPPSWMQTSAERLQADGLMSGSVRYEWGTGEGERAARWRSWNLKQHTHIWCFCLSSGTWVWLHIEDTCFTHVMIYSLSLFHLHFYWRTNFSTTSVKFFFLTPNVFYCSNWKRLETTWWFLAYWDRQSNTVHMHTHTVPVARQGMSTFLSRSATIFLLGWAVRDGGSAGKTFKHKM